MEHAVVMGSGNVVLSQDLPADLFEKPRIAPRNFYEAVDEFKRRLLTLALDEANGHSGQAGALLGLPPKTIHRHLKSLNLSHQRRKRFTTG